jgi:hypothetical protein
LSNGANIKWLADYCGTSIVMIEKHYGKYIRNDVDEQLARVLEAQTETLNQTLQAQKEEKRGQVVEKAEKKDWWAHLDSNTSVRSKARQRKKPGNSEDC